MTAPPLTDINPHNVASLVPIWQIRTGIQPRHEHFALEGTPLMIGDTLYACTGDNDVLALDPDTGAQRWRFHARIKPKSVVLGVCRGISYAETPTDISCPRRIILGTVDARPIALNTATGRLCPGFGRDGGADVDHTTIYRWVQHYAPEMEKRLRWYWKRPGFWAAGGWMRLT